MADYSGMSQWAAILPNQFPSQGDAMMYQQQRQDRQAAQMYEQQQRQAAEDKQNQYRMFSYLKDTLDPEKYNTGVQQIDALFDDQIQKLFDKYSGSMKNYQDISAFANDLQREMTPLIHNYGQVTANYKTQKEALDEWKKNNPDLDFGKLNNDLVKGLAVNYGTTDKDGNYKFKSPDEAQPFDFVGNLNDPMIASNYMSGNDNLRKYLSNAPGGQPIEAYNKDRAGGLTNFKTTANFWMEPAFEYDPANKAFTKGGVTPSLRVKGQRMTMPDGSTKGLIDEEVFKTIMGDTRYARAFYKDVRDRNPGADLSKMNPIEKDAFLRSNMYDIADTATQKDFAVAGYQRPERPQSNNNYINLNSPDNQWAYGATQAVKSGNLDLIKSEFGKLHSGKGATRFDDVTIGESKNGKPALIVSFSKGDRPLMEYNPATKKQQYIKYDPETQKTEYTDVAPEKGDQNYKMQPAYDYETIELDDSDLYPKLEGLYQEITGTDQPSEKTVTAPKTIKGYTPPGTQQKASKGYNINGKGYTHDQLMKMGYSQDQIQEAIKLGTIKPR